MPIAPRPEQLAAFAQGAPGGQPIHMLNLLKYREKAAYADGRATDLSGREAYGLYGAGVTKLVAELGGRIDFAGACQTLLIGDGDLAWDDVAIVQYPTIDAFREMTASAAYAALHVHREAGLAHQLLIHCRSPEQARVGLGAHSS